MNSQIFNRIHLRTFQIMIKYDEVWGKFQVMKMCS